MNSLRDTLGKFKGSSGYLKWIMSYAKPFRGRLTLIMLMSLVASLISLGITLISKQIIDRATGDQGGILVFVVIYGVCVLLNIVLELLRSLFTVLVSEKFTFGIRKQIYEKILRSRWMSVPRYHTGDLMTRLTSDAQTVADGIISVLPDIVRLCIDLVICFFTLFYFSPMMAFFALLIAPVGGILSLFLGRVLKRMQVKVQESESAYRSFLQESLANLLIIKSFSNEDWATQRMSNLRDERFFWVFKKSKMSIATSGVISGVFQLGSMVAFAYGAIQVSRKAITYGTMTVFQSMVGRIQSPIYMLAQNIPRLVSVIASAGRIMELQDISMEVTGKAELEGGQVGVSIKGLSFGYTDEKVLKNVEVDIRSGEIAAVVGESGVGKTTLVRLLMSFMEGDEGSLELFTPGGAREEMSAASRKYISYVPQGNTLFSGTIRANVLMGRMDASVEEQEEALRLAAAYDFVMALPDGIDTVIGEKGFGISEGQAQRIAIARALIKKAPILILDEATSSLDKNTELAVLEGVRRLTPRPTCLIITHRLTVLDYCDRQIVINEGLVNSADID